MEFTILLLIGFLYVQLFWIFRHMDKDCDHDLWKVSANGSLICGLLLIIGAITNIII